MTARDPDQVRPPAGLLQQADKVAVGIVWAQAGRPKVAWDFTIVDGRVVHIDMLAAPESLDDLDLAILDA